MNNASMTAKTILADLTARAEQAAVREAALSIEEGRGFGAMFALLGLDKNSAYDALGGAWGMVLRSVAEELLS